MLKYSKISIAHPKENNIEKKREHARKYANKKQMLLVACRELMRCLL